jgi:hypothetical protein
MKRFLFAMALATATAPAFAADVGVSVSIGQPGFFGHIDIGNAPPPRLVFAEPIVIERTEVVRQPIYLHVRPGHEKNWRKHCRKYDACGQPVYFVQDDWYNNVYVPHHRKNNGHGDKGDGERRDDKGHGKGNRND